MRVLHLIGGGDVGGAKTHVVTLLSGLSKTITVSLVSFREGEFAKACREAGIDVHVADGGFISELKAVLNLAGGYDIIHCHGARANLVGAVLKGKLKKPIVTTVHSDYRLDYLGRPLARISFGMMNKIALRRFDFYEGVSEPMTQLLMSRGFPPERQFTIYNGIDFRAEVYDDRTKKELALALDIKHREGDIYAGIAARFDPVKDLPTLIKAAAALKTSCPKLKVLIAGNGNQSRELEKLNESLDAGVIFCGWVKDMDSFFRLLDINVLTSLYETFPYALTEGARMKLATVASAVGGIPVLIDHGITGFLFKPGDDEALAGFLKILYDNPLTRETMGRKIYEKALSSFSIDAMLKTQLGIYQSVLRRSKRPKKRREGLTLCGAYGMDNSGDDAILEAILYEIRKLDPDIPVRVLSRNPSETRNCYKERSFHTFNVPAFTHAVAKSRIYLSGGGNLVQDITSSRSLWFYLFTIFWAKKMGCRVLMYGCGVGPVTSKFNRAITRAVLKRNVEVITLREEGSRQELTRMGIEGPEIVITADPALILQPESQEKVDSLMFRQNIPPQGKYICFALRDWPGYREKLEYIGAAAEHAYKVHGLTPVFIPVDRKQDVKAAELAAQYTSCPHFLLTEAGSARVTIGLLSRMEVVVAMRLHALIFAAGCGIPLVGISYNEKVTAFLDYIGQSLSTPLEYLTLEKLKADIDSAVVLEPERNARLEAVNRLREREKANIEVLAKMLNVRGSST